MRICFVAFQFWPSVGGSQTQAEKQARYLRQLGQDVLVITLRHQRAWPVREERFTFPVVRIGGVYKRNGTLRTGRFGYLFIDLLLFLTLWRLRRSYDLIHTLQLSPLATIAVLIGKLTHKPVIVGIQSAGQAEPVSDLPLGEQGMQRNAVHALQCKAEPVGSSIHQELGGDILNLRRTAWGGNWMLNYLRKSDAYYQILSSRSYLSLVQHGFCPERIVSIPNGVDTKQFYPASLLGKTTQSQQRTLLCVARLEYAKGIDVLLQAWACMMALPADWRAGFQPRLCLVGDGTYRGELELMAMELGIWESVEFLGTRLDILALLQRAWGFVLPSRWEGMPNALLEAMACGLPCIATQVSGSEDIIEQGVNGLLVQPEQVEHLAYALRLLLEDTNLAWRFGWRGYETILHSYQLSTVVQSCLTFYSYLLKKYHIASVSPGDVPISNIFPEESGTFHQDDGAI